MKTFATLALGSLACATFFCGCGTARVASQQSTGPALTKRPQTIYVQDFELEAADIKAQRGLLPTLPKMPGPLGDALPPLPGTPKDPKKLARELVNAMSENLVKEISRNGLTARRLSSTAALPATGWIVRGTFVEVNQGHQLRRAVVGFGLGKTDLQVIADVADLSQGAPKKFYEVKTAADSGRAPGAGPTIVLGPAGLAARFIMAGKDLSRDVKKTATVIASEVARRTQRSPTSAAQQLQVQR